MRPSSVPGARGRGSGETGAGVCVRFPVVCRAEPDGPGTVPSQVASWRQKRRQGCVCKCFLTQSPRGNEGEDGGRQGGRRRPESTPGEAPAPQAPRRVRCAFRWKPRGPGSPPRACPNAHRDQGRVSGWNTKARTPALGAECAAGAQATPLCIWVWWELVQANRRDGGHLKAKVGVGHPVVLPTRSLPRACRGRHRGIPEAKRSQSHRREGRGPRYPPPGSTMGPVICNSTCTQARPHNLTSDCDRRNDGPEGRPHSSPWSLGTCPSVPRAATGKYGCCHDPETEVGPHVTTRSPRVEGGAEMCLGKRGSRVAGRADGGGAAEHAPASRSWKGQERDSPLERPGSTVRLGRGDPRWPPGLPNCKAHVVWSHQLGGRPLAAAGTGQDRPLPR